MASEKKKLQVNDLVEQILHSPHFALIQFVGVTHTTLEQVRRELKKQGSRLKIVKNSLFQKAVHKAAAQNSHLKSLQSVFPLRENSAFLSLGEDFQIGLKVFSDATKQEEGVSFKFGLLGNKLYEGPEVMRIAQLPSRPELMGKLVTIMQGPSRNLAYALQFQMSKLVYLLNQKANQTKGGEN